MKTPRALIVLFALGFGSLLSAAAGAEEIVVYKTPWCGCCSAWVDHLKDNGFSVKTHDVEDLNQIKINYGVTQEVASCHTAIVDGYVVEGHVPADVIRRLLKEKPLVTGIATPGMPIGSPGMEVEGKPADHYDIVTFDAAGNVRVYEKR